MVFLRIVGLVLLAGVARAEDWPQWRGPNRDAAWNETNIIESFPAGGLKISWRAAVGTGFSSPIVANGRVYVSDSHISGRKARERVHCFDEKTGRSLWSHSYEVDYAEWAFDPTNPFGPRPTPIAREGRVYALGARGRLICFDGSNGKIVWQKQFENKSKDSAFTPSPLIEGKVLILVLDGLPVGPCVVALDKGSGKEMWRAVDGPATLSSPIVISAGGKRQLILWMQGAVYSLEPLTGKLNWREQHVGGAAYAVATPAVQEDLVMIGGIVFRLDGQKPGASVVWPDGRPPSRKLISDTSGPLWQGDYLYTCNMSGALACIEAKTGLLIWETNRVTDTKSGASIHITSNGNSALLFTDQGELIRARLAPSGYVEISRARLLEPTYPFGSRKCAWTPPAYANGHVFARSDKEIVCASLEGGQ